MESDDGSAPHGYGLRSHGPVATDPASLDAMVGPGLAQAISSAEDPALGARMVAEYGQDASHPLLSPTASPGTGNGVAQSPLARLGVGTLPSAHLRSAAARSKPRASPRPMDKTLSLKTPALPGTASKPPRLLDASDAADAASSHSSQTHAASNVYDEDATSSQKRVR
jgi:hypothetical protein